MRKIVLISTLALSLQGCWFVFIPGSVIDATADAFTGAEGTSCVPEAAVVGTKILVAGQSPGTVKSLSGKSIRCKDPRFPIRALVVPDA